MKKLILILLTISLLFLPFGQITRVVVTDLPVFIFLFEPFVAILSAVLFLIIYREKTLKHNRFAISTVVFLLWMGITFLISIFFYPAEADIVAFLYYLRLSMYLILILGLFTFFNHYKGLKKPVRDVIWISATGIVLFSLVQFFLYPNLGNLAYLGWDPHLDRLVGLFFDPPITVAVFALLGIFAFLSLKNQILKYSVFLIFFILSLLTYSRGGILALFFVMLLYFLRRVAPLVRWATVAFIILMSIVFVILPQSTNESLNLKRTTSIFTRVNDYEKAIKIWEKNPILGIGYNHIRLEKDQLSEELITEKYNPSHASASFHSSFLIVMVTSGVIGLILFLYYLLQLALLNEYSLYAVIFLAVISQSDNVFLHPIILLLLGALIAVYPNHRVHT